MTLPLFFTTVLAALPACPVVATDRASPELTDALISDVPHVRQKPDFCGEACTEMFLRKLDRRLDQDGVFELAGVDPAEGRGARTPELASALRRIGFEPGPVWYKVAAGRAAEETARLFEDLHGDLARGVPSIVCTRFDARPGASEHFRLVLGYDAAKDEVIYHEPAEDDGAYRRMARERFLELWPLQYDEDQWTVIRMRLDLAVRPPTPHRAALERKPRFGPADFAQHVLALKRRLSEHEVPSARFTVVVEPPFVVLGDEPAGTVRRRAKDTVRWAVERLKRQYFREDPLRILDVWLFKGEASYRSHAKLLFGDEPSTPFGYYSSQERALVMNIATGGGTLVHEIVHPFIEADLPGCPSWFNEGLASLYEQSSERGGKIVGLTNWRLGGLQEAIRGDRLPSFETLLATSSSDFYGDERGTNYAQARYLCLYLQEKGLLGRYYQLFRDGRARDPTGRATLAKILGYEDLGEFQELWEEWVLGLRFP